MISFITSMGSNRWGGSEELWSQTAIHLSRKGVPVSVNIAQSSPPLQILDKLLRARMKVQQRPMEYKLIAQAWKRVVPQNRRKSWLVLEAAKFLRAERPAVVVLSDGEVLPPLELMELCIEKNVPFVALAHSCSSTWWPEDEQFERLRFALSTARRCYFICQQQQSLVESRLDVKLSNVEVVRNPYNVAFNSAPAWPSSMDHDELRLAGVGRLDANKGYDMLFEALAEPNWLARPWRLNLYGEGKQKNGLMRFCARLGIGDRVAFLGHESVVERVWFENHALVLPSRREGLPLVIVEAMLCGRPVLATNVGGIKEIIEDEVTGFIADAPTAESIRNALERLWTRRGELEEMGRAGARSIREVMPANPVEVFSNKLLQLL